MVKKNRLDASLSKYIKEQVKSGYSLKSIKKVMVNYGYSDSYVDNLLRKHHGQESAKKFFSVAVVLLAAVVFSLNFILSNDSSNFTGFVIKEDIQQIKRNARNDSNTAPQWNSESNTLVIFGDYTINLSRHFNDLDTNSMMYNVGLVSNMTIILEGELVTFIPDSGYYGSADTIFSAYDGWELVTKEVTIIVKENITIKEEDIKTITAQIDYNEGTIYDKNNNGRVPIAGGVVDLTVDKTTFSWEVETQNLCARWEIFNLEEESLTQICNGGVECCRFVDLLPTKEHWSEEYYLTFGKDGSGYNNIVSAQIIYYDVELSSENVKSEIYYSNWANRTVEFYQD